MNDLVGGEDPYLLIDLFILVVISLSLKFLVKRIVLFYNTKPANSLMINSIEELITESRKLASNIQHFKTVPTADYLNPLDYKVTNHNSFLFYSQKLYRLQLTQPGRADFLRRVMLFLHYKINPVIEQWLPPILFIGALLYFLLFTVKPLEVSLVIAVFNIFLSLVLSLLNLHLPLSVLSITRKKIGLESADFKAFRNCILLFHFTGFLRSWGVFSRTIDSLRWIFRE